MIWKCEISKNQSVPNLKYSCQVFVTPSFWFFDILQKTSMFKREPWMAYTRDHGWKVGGNGMIKSFLDFSWIYWNQYYIVGYYILPSFFHILVYRVEFVFLLWCYIKSSLVLYVIVELVEFGIFYPRLPFSLVI